MRIVDSSVSVEGARCAAILRRAYFSADAFVAAHVSQTSLEQDSSESPSEVLIEDGVDDRIERRIHVPQPEGRREGDTWDVVGQSQDVHEEEGQPAGDERTHDETQDESSAFFFFSRDSPLFPFWVSRFLNAHFLHHALLA